MTACPYCGSIDGYYYRVKTTVIVSGAWGVVADIEKDEDYPWILPKTARCAECDKKVNRIKAGDRKSVNG